MIIAFIDLIVALYLIVSFIYFILPLIDRRIVIFPPDLLDGYFIKVLFKVPGYYYTKEQLRLQNISKYGLVTRGGRAR